MLLVGHVAGRTAILVDDLADTSNTITRAAKLLKKEGATQVYALVTHGVLSGDAIERIMKSDLDKVVVTNSVPQDEHLKHCPKLEVLEVGTVFAEVSFYLFLTIPCLLGQSLDADQFIHRPFDVCTTVRASVFCSSTTSGCISSKTACERRRYALPAPTLDD